MLRATLANIRGHKLRVAVTALAIIAGVTFMSGTFVLTDTITVAFDDLFTSGNQGIDAVVRREAAFDQPSSGGFGAVGPERGDIDRSVGDDIRSVDGVAAAEPDLFGNTVLLRPDGERVGPAQGPPQFGGNWIPDRELNSFTLVKGQPPTSGDEVVIDTNTSNDASIGIGDTIRYTTIGPTKEATVTGLINFGDAGSAGGAGFALTSTDAAIQAFSSEGKVQDFFVRAESGVSQSDLVSALKPALPDGVEAITGTTYAEEQASDINEGFSTFTTVLNAFAGIALLAGAFLIYNIFGIVVAQRTRELALLRILGARSAQVRTSVLAEAVATGMLASIVGLGTGILLAIGLTAALAGIGLDLPNASTVVAPRTIVASLVVGTGITLVSALVPARRAARVSPMTALTEAATGPAGHSRRRVAIGLVLGGLSVLGLVAGAISKTLEPTLFGAVGLFAAIAVLGPVIAPTVAGTLGAPVARLRGLTGRLARQNAVREPKRTASTSLALILVLALIGILSVFLSSFTASINAAVSQGLKADFEMGPPGGGGGGFGGISPDLTAEARKLDQVGAATGIRLGTAGFLGKGQTVFGADGPALAQTLDVGVEDGSLDDLVGENRIAVDEGAAELFDLGVGSTAKLRSPAGEVRDFDVVATYSDPAIIGQGVEAKFLLSEAAFASFEPAQAQQDLRVLVTASAGTSNEALRGALDGLTEQFPSAEVRDTEEIQQQQTQQINQGLSFVLVLLALSVFIGFLGVAITLALSVIERTRELGLLRAVGMTRTGVRGMVRWEAVIVTAFATLVGLAVGVACGIALSLATSGEFETYIVSVPFAQLIGFAVLAGILGLVAAVVPARRAAKLDVLRAVTVE